MPRTARASLANKLLPRAQSRPCSLSGLPLKQFTDPTRPEKGTGTRPAAIPRLFRGPGASPPFSSTVSHPTLLCRTQPAPLRAGRAGRALGVHATGSGDSDRTPVFYCLAGARSVDCGGKRVSDGPRFLNILRSGRTRARMRSLCAVGRSERNWVRLWISEPR
jgi:hypothetical protein